jgi:hypothetical protein
MKTKEMIYILGLVKASLSLRMDSSFQSNHLKQ